MVEKLEHLNTKDAEAVKKIIRDHSEVIAISFEDPSLSIVEVTHRFELASENPIYKRQEGCRLLITRLFARESITCFWWYYHASGVVMDISCRYRKTGSLRFCFDYRNLNSATRADRWQLPRLEEIFDELQESSVFKTTDLFQGHSCKEKAAFICIYETFQFKIMQVGLKNSQVTSQRMMVRVPLKVDNVRRFVDNVVIFSKKTEENAMHLENLLCILQDNRLRLKMAEMIPYIMLSKLYLRPNRIIRRLHREYIGGIFALKKFRHNSTSNRFKLYTDDKYSNMFSI